MERKGVVRSKGDRRKGKDDVISEKEILQGSMSLMASL